MFCHGALHVYFHTCDSGFTLKYFQNYHHTKAPSQHPIDTIYDQAIDGMEWTDRMGLRKKYLQVRQQKHQEIMKHINGALRICNLFLIFVTHF